MVAGGAFGLEMRSALDGPRLTGTAAAVKNAIRAANIAKGIAIATIAKLRLGHRSRLSSA
jgi:hypothetical protein